MTTRIALLVACLSSSLPAIAQERPFKFELTPYGAYRTGGDFEERNGAFSIDIDDSESFGIILNARHSPITQWEILYSRQATTADAAGSGLTNSRPDLTIHYLQAGGTYLWDGDAVRPYLAATLGGTHIEIDSAGSDSDTFFSFSLGLGLQVKPSSRVGLRLEARGFGTLIDSDSKLFCQFGPMNNVCAVQLNGTIMWQVEALAGVVFRF